MKIIKLEYNTDLGTSYLHDKPEIIFDIWKDHYEEDLKSMFLIFNKKIKQNNFNIKVDFDSFSKFIFENSTKYLSRWI